MKIELAKAAGFCFGVKRSVKLSKETLAKGSAYLYGMPVHNQRVVQDIVNRGGKLVEDNPYAASKISKLPHLTSMDEVPSGSTVLMRAHGVPVQALEKAREKGFNVVDTTCPFVTMVHKTAKELYDAKYQVIVIGEHGHPEVEGIKSYAPNALVVETPEEAKKLFLDKKQYFTTDEIMRETESGQIVEKLYYPTIPKLGIVSQTTQSNDNVEAIVSVLQNKAREVRVYNTICNAMHEMQPGAVELAHKADCMIIIGGKNSGNTKRQYELCSKITDTKWVESREELKDDWFKGKKHVGIGAGASTPDEDIEDVVNWLIEYDHRANHATPEIIRPAYVVH
ncbi:MAG: 4-hydroxy-3-methylbut-2-enyl diphosphate reductase [Candidatus Diapherotrites archaeon]|nr:4-hydroxy-3-methylbut-2-enyl diphosphate reductase [Candidatus Diapherotrites archaeon]